MNASSEAKDRLRMASVRPRDLTAFIELTYSIRHHCLPELIPVSLLVYVCMCVYACVCVVYVIVCVHGGSLLLVLSFNDNVITEHS